MPSTVFFLAISLVLGLFVSSIQAGFLDKPWLTNLKEAKALAAQEQKPILVQFTKTGCGPCNQFKSTFRGSDEEIFDQLADQFVLVHFVDNAGSSYPELSPDGQYFPHTVFLNHEGKVQPQIMNEQRVAGQNPANVQYKYFFTNLQSLLSAMNTALVELKQ